MLELTVPIIVASQSPRRTALLRQIGLPHLVDPSSITEEIDPASTPEENVRRLAQHKAEDVASRHRTGIVIGSDTIVVIDGRVLGKPKHEEDAFTMLRTLSGCTHTVHTGYALVDAATKKMYIGAERTEVTFRDLSDEEIRGYIRSGSPMDKAGSYGIQDDYGAVFVRRIEGDYYTVVGFPLSSFFTAFLTFTDELGVRKGSL